MESTFYSPPRPKKKNQHHTNRALSTSSSVPSLRSNQVAVAGDKGVTSTLGGRNGVDIHPPTPGPGQYHQPTSFVKPSFNRMYTEPEPALPLAKAANLAHTMAPRSSHNVGGVSNNNNGGNSERVEYRPALGSPSTPNRTMTEDEKSNMVRRSLFFLPLKFVVQFNFDPFID